MPVVAAIEPTDEDLLTRVADGDRDAFGDLYRRYARAVLGLVLCVESAEGGYEHLDDGL